MLSIAGCRMGGSADKQPFLEGVLPNHSRSGFYVAVWELVQPSRQQSAEAFLSSLLLLPLSFPLFYKPKAVACFPLWFDASVVCLLRLGTENCLISSLLKKMNQDNSVPVGNSPSVPGCLKHQSIYVCSHLSAL